MSCSSHNPEGFSDYEETVAVENRSKSLSRHRDFVIVRTKINIGHDFSNPSFVHLAQKYLKIVKKAGIGLAELCIGSYSLFTTSTVADFVYFFEYL
jgi:hypothetical protein